MIAPICLLALLGLSNCLEQLPSRREIEMSINRTIDEVERMVSADPSLPRLSRSEIVDILFNITSTDMDSYNDRVEKTREDYQRALMVVLPYSAKDSGNESLNDLFTKAPHMRILPESPKSAVSSPSNSIVARNEKGGDRPEDPAKRYKNHRDIYTEVSSEPPSEQALRKLLDSGKRQIQAPEKFGFNVAGLDSQDSANLRNRAVTQGGASIEIVYSSSVTESPITTKMIVHTTQVSPVYREPTMPPTRSTQNVLTSDQWRYNAPPAVTTIRPRAANPEVVDSRRRPTSHHFLPTAMTPGDPEVVASTIPTTTPKAAGAHRGDVAPQYGNEGPALVYVTPMTANTPEASEDPTTAVTMRQEVQSLLESIGLRPEGKTSDVKSGGTKRDQDAIFGGNFRVPVGGAPGAVSGGPGAPEDGSPAGKPLVPEEAPRDVRLGASNLAPEVRELFQRFGLQTSGKEADQVRVTASPRPLPVGGEAGAWGGFKPLPVSEVRDQGMREFLAKFGLGKVRNEKAVKERMRDEGRPSLIEAVPGNMRQILENIGLIRKPQRAASGGVVHTTVKPQLHVFKPHETSLDDERQRTRINALLDTVKRVQEGKADAVAVQHAAKELLETTRYLKNGPDPLSLDEILRIYNDDLKNEIKRQQDPKDLADMAASETPDTSSTTTPTPDSPISTVAPGDSASASSDTGSSPTDFLSVDLLNDPKNAATEESTTANSNLEALADSFGGSTAAPDPVLPTRRKTGLYFLVDWNTFLEVGEEGTDKVNLRFQPKVGDRTRFLPVTVP